MTAPQKSIAPRRFLATATSAIVLSSLLFAACSSSAPPPSTTTTTSLAGFAGQEASAILSQGCAATLASTSLVNNATFRAPAQVGGVKSMHWILSTAANKGTVTYQGGGIVQSVIQPVVSYIKGNQKYWSTNATPPQAATASALANKWVSLNASSGNWKQASALIQLSSLQGLLSNCTAQGTMITKGTTATVAGNDVITIKIVNAGVTQVLSIQSAGKHYIVKSITTGGASGNETALLSGFNAQKTPRAPTPSTSIDPILAS